MRANRYPFGLLDSLQLFFDGFSRGKKFLSLEGDLFGYYFFVLSESSLSSCCSSKKHFWFFGTMQLYWETLTVASFYTAHPEVPIFMNIIGKKIS